MATVSAATLLMTACQPGDDGADSTASPSGAPASPTVSSTGSPKPATSPGGSGSSAKPAGDSTPKAPGSASATSTPTTKTCAAESLKAFLYQADVRPDGTGIGAVIAEFTNMSSTTCAVQGHPTVAGAPNGSPEKNHLLAVTPTGSAPKVLLAPGAKAWVKVTFVQVQGEGDGYCVSGSDPVTYPTLVVALPSGGAHQLALDDGALAECDDKATVTAVTATKPS
ncbi:DUF4232 domain-containing protein [Streptomyces sp. NPDC002935]|uniref:DUF4232 domain-containing protein n=1 Tax=Streptomyces sp. NPDC002935 TaxID=3154545 RepID=UPI0033ACFA26